MTKTTREERTPGVLSDALSLDHPKTVLKQYYAGQQILSPQGGVLLPLAVRPTGRGGAVALFECSASSLRYQLEIPKATRTERKKVREAVEAALDPDCPRHGAGHRLTRAGNELVCAACGVSYGKV